MSAPSTVEQLVARFERNHLQYRSASYNETQLRREFVDPFFEALGWDVNNRQGWAEPYKDVVHEDSIRIGGAVKAPDYAFRVGGVRKFFVETKRPSVDLKTAPDPALQLRRYAWSAKLPLSVLTDFEELAVYDTRLRPKASDKAEVGRVLYFRFEDYVTHWSSLESLLSREAVLRGDFDRFVESSTKKRGTADVDDAFLQDMEGWREKLARELALRNKLLSTRELNLLTQRILDRIIFLRIAEDRGLEDYGRLLSVADGQDIYRRLKVLWERAEERYNSGLFYFRREKGRLGQPDSLSGSAEIGDPVLKALIKGLYYPQSPYEFSVIPADILGQVYERFLGKVVRLTPAHRAVVEDRPEVRKQGGVYYTPTYVVDEIVRRAVEPGLSSLKAGPRGGASRFRVLDPACGSGSFLLAVYQFLLDWHLEAYLADGAGTHSERLVQTGVSTWRLTTAERKRILLNGIFGVDVDAQAVEVTKLSLLLKVLEGESAQNVAQQLALFHERALPDLSDNIRCGNSLIEPDFFEQGSLDVMDPETRLEINAMTWASEFPAIVAGGGFDAVVGNPPYVLLQALERPDVSAYLGSRYKVAKYKIDTYHLFFERALGLLSKDGRLGFITPVSFLRNKHAYALRELILKDWSVECLQVFEYPVFVGASVDTCVTVIAGRRARGGTREGHFLRARSRSQVDDLGRIDVGAWQSHEALHFGPPGSKDESALARRLASECRPLGEFADAYFGIQTYVREQFVSTQPTGSNPKPVVDGKNIAPFHLSPAEEYVDFTPGAIKSGGRQDIHDRDRIGVRQIGRTPVAALIPGGTYALNTIYNVFLKEDAPVGLEYVLGALQSSVGQWYWDFNFFDQKRTFPKIKKQALLSFPVPLPTGRAALHQDIQSRVRRVISLNAQMHSSHSGQNRNSLARQLAHELARLDDAYFAAYGLTSEEAELIKARVASMADAD
jgi:hypothetical protein